MKKVFYPCLLLLLSSLYQTVNAQNFFLQRAIIVTDTIEDEGVVFEASSDDAEQQNDEIDALYDDDLDAGWEGAPEDQNILITGLRFRDITIPQGATIDSAFVLFWAHEGKGADDVARITVTGEAVDNASTFTEDALISTRPHTAASVLWEVAEEWEIWQPYHTPNIKGIVQEIVGRNGWTAGNDLAVFLSGENQGLSEVENAREFESFENISDPEDGGDGQNHPERRPQLLVYYSVSNARLEIPIMVTDTIEDEGVVFEASSDDAEQQNDEIDALYDDDLDAGWEGAPEDQNILTTGLRFRNIGIPKGAVIDSAFIELWAHEGKGAEDVARITIFGENGDDAQTYTEDALISDRPRTTATQLWEVAEEWQIWEKHQTPDLKSIIQEIIARPNWQPGNSLAFMLLGENQGLSEVENAREFESYENISDPEDGGDGQNHPERRPRLVVYYSSPSSAVQDIFSPSAKSLKVYPNPAKPGAVRIELGTEEASVIRLFDANGRVVSTMQSSNGKNVVFQTGKLSAGIYYFQALQGRDLYVQKLIIQP